MTLSILSVSANLWAASGKTDYFWDMEVQGVQDQKCQKEMAISLEGNTFDPTLVKPKCV